MDDSDEEYGLKPMVSQWVTQILVALIYRLAYLHITISYNSSSETICKPFVKIK